MATRAVLTPKSAEFPASNFPELKLINRRPVLSFDGATSETCMWTGVAPTGITGTLTLVLSLIFPTATTGACIFAAAVEAVTSADATDLDAGDSFDSDNNSSAISAPATAGYMVQGTITLTNKDSIAAGDLIRILLKRLPADASDTITTDAQLLTAEFKDAA
jgi:hypothetical protein